MMSELGPPALERLHVLSPVKPMQNAPPPPLKILQNVGRRWADDFYVVQSPLPSRR